MFGHKRKEIDPELLKQNVVATVIDLWTNKTTLQVEKFHNVAGDEKFVMKFFREKLRIIMMATIISVYKAISDDKLLDEITAEVKKQVADFNEPDIKGAEAALGFKAREYATSRTSNNPREAGSIVEDRFAKEVLGYIPGQSNVDTRYTLMKQLSGLERRTIIDINVAIRQSRV